MDEKCIKLIVIGIIAIITLFTICRIGHVNKSTNRGWGEYSTKLVGVVFIVAIAIIAFVYDSNSNSAFFTLLGTLAGYFLGYRRNKEETGDES